MNTSSPIHVGAILFEGFELLDFFGPLEMFGLLEGAARITVVAEKPGAVKSSSGPCGMADATMASAGGFDVLLIPGGIGIRKEMANAQFLGELKRLAEASRMVATVCTGSLLLARTGLIDGRKATTNKRSFSTGDDLCTQGELGRKGPVGGGWQILHVIGCQRRNGHGAGGDSQVLRQGDEFANCGQSGV